MRNSTAITKRGQPPPGSRLMAHASGNPSTAVPTVPGARVTRPRPNPVASQTAGDFKPFGDCSTPLILCKAVRMRPLAHDEPCAALFTPARGLTYRSISLHIPDSPRPLGRQSPLAFHRNSRYPSIGTILKWVMFSDLVKINDGRIRKRSS